jgi:hypothetical protein
MLRRLATLVVVFGAGFGIIWLLFKPEIPRASAEALGRPSSSDRPTHSPSMSDEGPTVAELVWMPSDEGAKRATAPTTKRTGARWRKAEATTTSRESALPGGCGVKIEPVEVVHGLTPDGEPLRRTRFAVVRVVAGSPCDRAGVLVGDTIARVQGHEIRVDSAHDVSAGLRGPSGTAVRLKWCTPAGSRRRVESGICRPHERMRTATIVRQSWAEMFPHGVPSWFRP